MQVAWIEIKAESLSGFNGFKSSFRGNDIECYFGWMYFKREFYAALVEHVEDRVPELSKAFETLIDHFFAYGREAVDHMPDRGAGKPLTTLTPIFFAARAVSFMAAIAHLREFFQRNIGELSAEQCYRSCVFRDVASFI